MNLKSIQSNNLDDLVEIIKNDYLFNTINIQKKIRQKIIKSAINYRLRPLRNTNVMKSNRFKPLIKNSIDPIKIMNEEILTHLDDIFLMLRF